MPPARPRSLDHWHRLRTEVHRLRGRVDAVLTGVGTVKADDCRLDPRLYRPRQIPMVAVASRSGPIPQSASIQNNTNNIHLTGSTPAEQLAALAKMSIQVVLLEAGPTLLHAYWQSGLIDEAWVFVGPVSMPNGSGKSPIPNPRRRSAFTLGSTMSFGPDRLYRLPIAATDQPITNRHDASKTVTPHRQLAAFELDLPETALPPIG